MLQGQYTIDAEEFSRPRWRRPNLARDSGYYVAQVQVVHPIYVTSLAERGESNVKQFAVDMADSIEALLPLTPRNLRSAGTSKSTTGTTETLTEQTRD